VIFTATGATATSAKWQYNPNNGTWIDATADARFTEVSGSYTTLTFTVTPLVANYSFRVIFSNCRGDAGATTAGHLKIGTSTLLYGASPDLPNPPAMVGAPDFLPVRPLYIFIAFFG
jgi:hypothetical protein